MALFGGHIKGNANWYKLLLLSAAVIWGLGFVLMKDAVGVVTPSWLLAIRFGLSGIILAVVFFKKLRAFFTWQHIVYGSLLGVMLFAAFWVQTVGLIYTTPGKNAFLTASYVVLIPFIHWIVSRKRPSLYNLIAALLCIVGMGMVSLQESLTFGFGELLTIMSAALFGLHIVYVSKWSTRFDVMVMTVYQFLAASICGILVGAFTEPLPALAAVLEPSFVINMAYLAVFASSIALAFQNVSLKHVPPAQASLFLSMEAVFGVLFSVLIYGERLGLRLIAGFCLIFIAIVVSETFPLKKVPWKRKTEEPPGDQPPSQGAQPRNLEPIAGQPEKLPSKQAATLSQQETT